MTDCGDQSHYKAFFSFNRNFDESWFYNYVGPHARKEGFEYKNFNNSKDFADYCTVYANQSISCLPLTEMGGAGVNGGKGYDIQLLIRSGTSDTPEQKKFCPKIVMLHHFNLLINHHLWILCQMKNLHHVLAQFGLSKFECRQINGHITSSRPCFWTFFDPISHSAFSGRSLLPSALCLCNCPMRKRISSMLWISFSSSF